MSLHRHRLSLFQTTLVVWHACKSHRSFVHCQTFNSSQETSNNMSGFTRNFTLSAAACLIIFAITPVLGSSSWTRCDDDNSVALLEVTHVSLMPDPPTKGTPFTMQIDAVVRSPSALDLRGGSPYAQADQGCIIFLWTSDCEQLALRSGKNDRMLPFFSFSTCSVGVGLSESCGGAGITLSHCIPAHAHHLDQCRQENQTSVWE